MLRGCANLLLRDRDEGQPFRCAATSDLQLRRSLCVRATHDFERALSVCNLEDEVCIFRQLIALLCLLPGCFVGVIGWLDEYCLHEPAVPKSALWCRSRQKQQQMLLGWSSTMSQSCWLCCRSPFHHMLSVKQLRYAHQMFMSADDF